MNITDKKTAVIRRTKNILAPECLNKLMEGVMLGKDIFAPLTTSAEALAMLDRLLKDFTEEEMDDYRVSADPAIIMALIALLKNAVEDFITDCCDPVEVRKE